MADGVIIQDENGIEHEFPAGFDPIQAARIVRENSKKDQSSLGKFIDWAVSPTAAGVRAQTELGKAANVLDTTERTPVHRSVTDFVKDLPGTVSDIASGLVHNPVATLRGGAAGVAQGVGDVLASNSSPAAMAAIASGPAGRIAKSVPAAARLIRLAGGGANAVLGAKGAEEVLNAPDAEGKILGGVQMALGAHGLAADPMTVASARRVAEPTGRMLLKAAERPGFVRGTAIGAMGAGAAAGHPLAAASGLPLMLLPEGMKWAGNKLIEAGTGTAGLQPVAAATGAEPLARPETARTPIPMPDVETPQQAARRVQQSRPTSTGVPADVTVNSTAKYLQELSQLPPEARKAEFAARSTPEAQAARAAEAAPAEVAPVGAPAEPDVPVTGRMEDALAQRTPITEQDIRQGRTGDNWNQGRLTADKSAALPTELADQIGAIPDNPDWFKQNGPLDFDAQLAALEAGTPSEFTSEGSGPLDAATGTTTYEPPTEAGGRPVERATAGPEIGKLPLKQLTGEVDTGLPAGADVEGSGPTDNNPAPGPAVGDRSAMGTPQTTFEDALNSILAQGSAKPPTDINLTEPTVVPDTDPRVAGPVPAEAMPAPLPSRPVAQPTVNENGRISASDKSFHSKSRRSKSQMSATPGYSNRDLSDVGLNPSLKYKDFDPTIHAKILANRASRASKYYGDALEAKAQAEAGL